MAQQPKSGYHGDKDVLAGDADGCDCGDGGDGGDGGDCGDGCVCKG